MFKKIIEGFKAHTVKTFVENVLSIQAQEYKSLHDEELKIKAGELKKLLQRNQNLVEIAPYAFALAKTAIERVYPITVHNVQIEGAYHIALGKIAEMETGEGKTITAIMPVFLYALAGKGAHIITINPYLANRDYCEMKGIFKLLGLSVGLVSESKTDSEKQEAYSADVTYGDANCFAFDYLRDNLKYDLSDKNQREFYFALLDDIDEVLIDQARDPLSLVQEDVVLDVPLMKTVYGCINDLIEEEVETLETDQFTDLNDLDDEMDESDLTSDKRVKIVKPGDYRADRIRESIQLTKNGIVKIRGRLIGRMDSYDDSQEFQEQVNFYAAVLLRAHLFEKEGRSYIIEDNKIVLVDKVTQRAMHNRRYSGALHQALEIVNGLDVSSTGSKTIATITYHNYFTKYACIAGMTGTGQFNEDEFKRDYNLPVEPVATHKPRIRLDHDDKIYRTKREKVNTIVNRIKHLYQKGQPVLIGVPTVEDSEEYSNILDRIGIPHNVLNAKNHFREAEFLRTAGVKNSVTIVTKMAGRGVDIKLGPGVEELGGLFVLCTERNEERRIDLQFRGRTGRQGAPGESMFFLSLEDELMRLFGSERIAGVMDRMGLEDGEVITHPMISRSVERAQKRVTMRNAEIRQHLYLYDNVLDAHRNWFYGLRDCMLAPGREEIFIEFIGDYLDAFIENKFLGRVVSQQEIGRICNELSDSFGFLISQEYFTDISTKENLEVSLVHAFVQTLKKKIHAFGSRKESILKHIALNVLDSAWQSHLLKMEGLKEGIETGVTGNDNPLLRYQLNAKQTFEQFYAYIVFESLKFLFNVRLSRSDVFMTHEPEKQIDQYLKVRDLYSGKKSILASSPKRDQETMVKTEIYDLVYDDKIAHLKRWLNMDDLKSGENEDCSENVKLKINLRIFALAIRSYDEIHMLTDCYGKIISSFISVLKQLFNDAGEEISNNSSLCLCLLKFFLQMPKYLDSRDSKELKKIIDEFVINFKLNSNKKIINYLLEHVYNLLSSNEANWKTHHFIEPEYFSELFDQGQNTIYSFLSLTISFVKYGKFFEDIGLLDLPETSAQLLSYYSQVSQNEDYNSFNPAFINSSIRLKSCVKYLENGFDENIIRKNNEYLTSHIDALYRAVLDQHLINSNRLFNLTLHFERVSSMWSDSGYGYKSFEMLLMTYYLRKSFQDAIDLIENNISFLQFKQHEESSIGIDLRDLILVIYLSGIDEKLKINADICPLLIAIVKLRELPLFKSLHKSIISIYSLYRDYYIMMKPKSQHKMILEKLPELPEEDKNTEFGDQPLTLLDINLHFSLFLKSFLVNQKKYRDFIVNWDTISTDVNENTPLYITFRDEILRDAVVLFNRLSERRHSSEEISENFFIYLESYIYQLITILNQVPYIELLELLESVPVIEKIEKLIQLIHKNHVHFQNYLLLHQFIHFIRKLHSVNKTTNFIVKKGDNSSFFDRRVSKNIYTKIKNLIYQKYTHLEIYYWLYSDRNVIDEVNFWIEQI